MHEGRIRAVNADRGFGFISCPGLSCCVFFHMGDLDGGLEWGPVLQERWVCFNLVETERGRRAAAVRPLGSVAAK